MDANSYDNTPMRGGNEMEMEGEAGPMGMCIKIHIGADGRMSVGMEKDSAMPEDAQPAGSLDEAMQMARGMAEEHMNAGQGTQEMDDARRGYAKMGGGRPMEAVNPGGVFGE